MTINSIGQQCWLEDWDWNPTGGFFVVCFLGGYFFTSKDYYKFFQKGSHTLLANGHQTHKEWLVGAFWKDSTIPLRFDQMKQHCESPSPVTWLSALCPFCLLSLLAGSDSSLTLPWGKDFLIFFFFLPCPALLVLEAQCLTSKEKVPLSERDLSSWDANLPVRSWHKMEPVGYESEKFYLQTFLPQ